MNKMIIIGRTGADIVARKFESGTEYCFFDVADKDGYTDKNGKRVDQTEWHHCRVVGGLVKTLAGHIGKGSLISLEGKIVSSRDKDGKAIKENGKTLAPTVHVSRIEFLVTQDPVNKTAVAPTVGDANAEVVAALIKGGMSLEEAKKALGGTTKPADAGAKTTTAPTVVDNSDAIAFDK